MSTARTLSGKRRTMANIPSRNAQPPTFIRDAHLPACISNGDALVASVDQQCSTGSMNEQRTMVSGN
eukprot:scaffold11249_cov24-Tisochrysis_lutea.AAC.4